MGWNRCRDGPTAGPQWSSRPAAHPKYARASPAGPPAAGVPCRQQARLRPMRRRALAPRARRGPRGAAIRSHSAWRIGAPGRARQAVATRPWRRRLTPWRLMGPRRIAAPQAYALGGRPVERHRARSWGKRRIAPRAVAKVRATTSPMPGTRRETLSLCACAWAGSRRRRRLSRRWRVAQRPGVANNVRRAWSAGGSAPAALSRQDRRRITRRLPGGSRPPCWSVAWIWRVMGARCATSCARGRGRSRASF